MLISKFSSYFRSFIEILFITPYDIAFKYIRNFKILYLNCAYLLNILFLVAPILHPL